MNGTVQGKDVFIPMDKIIGGQTRLGFGWNILVVNDSMDVMGGSGICRGPANTVGNGYMSIPIAITVEGANILTRSMIIFGQGLNRAHPNLIKMVNAIERDQPYKGPSDKLRKDSAQLISTVTGIRSLLSEGVFISNDPNDKIRMLNDILPKALEADKAQAAAKKEKRELTSQESALVKEVQEVVNKLVQVDSFDKLGKEKFEPEDYIRPALRGTRFAETELARQKAIREKVTVAAPLK
eukprot:gene2142-2096_t